MTVPLIELKNVTKRFGNRTILDRVNLKIFEGDITTIIGKSGGGKSVLLKHIIGLLKPDEGDVLFGDKRFKDMNRDERKRFKQQVSYMFQHNALFDSLTVFENIALPLREKTSLKEDFIQSKVSAIIDQMELCLRSLKNIRHRYQAVCKNG